jgi:hypothetical protein
MGGRSADHSTPLYPQELTLTSPTFNSCSVGIVHLQSKSYVVRFEVFTAVTMKNGVFWDVTPFDSCKNRRFGEGPNSSIIRVTRMGELGT